MSPWYNKSNTNNTAYPSQNDCQDVLTQLQSAGNGCGEKQQEIFAMRVVSSSVQRGGERGDDPGHPKQGGIQRMKLQKCKCCN